MDLLKHPVIAIAFYLVAIGAFGLLGEMIRGASASLFTVTLHSGVVLYAWTKRGSLFADLLCGGGKDRQHGQLASKARR
ncbi:hypothetical protein D3C84_920770 [compost metagenome]